MSESLTEHSAERYGVEIHFLCTVQSMRYAFYVKEKKNARSDPPYSLRFESMIIRTVYEKKIIGRIAWVHVKRTVKREHRMRLYVFGQKPILRICHVIAMPVMWEQIYFEERRKTRNWRSRSRETRYILCASTSSGPQYVIRSHRIRGNSLKFTDECHRLTINPNENGYHLGKSIPVLNFTSHKLIFRNLSQYEEQLTEAHQFHFGASEQKVKWNEKSKGKNTVGHVDVDIVGNGMPSKMRMAKIPFDVIRCDGSVFSVEVK